MTIPKWLAIVLIAGAISGAVLDPSIFGIQAFQIRAIHGNESEITKTSASSKCWDKILNDAITHRMTPAYHAHLIRDAKRCAELPTG